MIAHPLPKGTKVNMRRHFWILTDVVITGVTESGGRACYTYRRESNGAEGVNLQSLVVGLR